MSGITAALAGRLEAYAKLRDEGMRPVDAAREVGVIDRTGDRYEAWYKSQRGMAPKRRNSPDYRGEW